jgi:hypothetical protein
VRLDPAPHRRGRSGEWCNMVTPGHTPMTPAERAVADELARQLKLLLVGRSIDDATALLTTINLAVAEGRTAKSTRH